MRTNLLAGVKAGKNKKDVISTVRYEIGSEIRGIAGQEPSVIYK
jgi:hypothetical protein